MCPLTVALPQIFFNQTAMPSYQVFFCLFHAPLDVVVHFLLFLRSFRFKSVLSPFSPFVAQIKTFCSNSGFFLLTMFAKDLTGCFSHCCLEGGYHWIQVCIFILHDGERCKLPAYHSLEGFKHIGIFWLFSSSQYKIGVIIWTPQADLLKRSMYAECRSIEPWRSDPYLQWTVINSKAVKYRASVGICIAKLRSRLLYYFGLLQTLYIPLRPRINDM